MNLEYLFLELPRLIGAFPFYQPDGLGMSVLITSPGLLLAARAPWRDRRSRLLLGPPSSSSSRHCSTTAVAGSSTGTATSWTRSRSSGRWSRSGSSIAARSARWGWVLIGWGVLVGLGGVYWAYHIG